MDRRQVFSTIVSMANTHQIFPRCRCVIQCPNESLVLKKEGILDMRLESARSERRYRPPRKGSNWSFHHHHELLCNFEKQIKRFLSIISGQQPCKRKMFFRLKKISRRISKLWKQNEHYSNYCSRFFSNFFLLLIKQQKNFPLNIQQNSCQCLLPPLKTSSSENT